MQQTEKYMIIALPKTKENVLKKQHNAVMIAIKTIIHIFNFLKFRYFLLNQENIPEFCFEILRSCFII